MSGYGRHKEEFADALKRAFPSKDLLGQMTYFKLDLNLETLPGESLPGLIMSLLQWAESEGRIRDLITAAREANNGNATLEGVATNLVTHLDEVSPLPWYRPPELLSTCFISPYKGVVDRNDLRSHLSELMPSDGLRTLVVRGETGSGRSYSVDFIRFVEGEAREFRVVHVDLRETGRIAPDELVDTIATQMGLSKEELETIPKKTSQGPRWNASLRDWLFAQMAKGNKPWWLVVDGIDQVKVPTETYDLIMKLVKEAERREPLRVVLLACSEPLPDDVYRVQVENIGAITDTALTDFFASFLSHKGVVATPEAVDQAVKEVLGKARFEREDPRWLKELTGLVAVAAQTLVAEEHEG